MLKYVKNTYLLIINSYFKRGAEVSSPGEERVPEKIKDSNNNGTNIDEIYKKLAEAMTKEKDPKRLKKIESINKQLKEELARINKLHGQEKEKALQVLKLAVQDYSKELVAYSQAKSEELKQKERIAANMEQVKEFNSYMREKAKQYINYVNNNPSAKANGVELKIEDGKVALYKKGKKMKYFSIPTMKPNGEIRHDENLARLNSYYKDGMDDFVKKYIPEVKTYAEIGQENIAKEKEQQRIAALEKEVKGFNRVSIDLANKSIDFVKKSGILPEGVDLVLDNGKIKLVKGKDVLKYFTLTKKGPDGKYIHPENMNKHVYANLKTWAEKALKEKNIIPKNEKLA